MAKPVKHASNKNHASRSKAPRQTRIEVSKSALNFSWVWLISALFALVAIAGLLYLNHQYPLSSDSGVLENTVLSDDDTKGTPQFEFYSELTAGHSPHETKQAPTLSNREHHTQATPPSSKIRQAQPHSTQITKTEHKKHINHPSSPEQVSNTRLYYIQVAAVSKAKDADQLKAQLTLESYPVHIETTWRDHQQWFRILLGPYHRFDQAEAIQQQLKQRGQASLLLSRSAPVA